jgi:hypothetical protein
VHACLEFGQRDGEILPPVSEIQAINCEKAQLLAPPSP